MIHASQFYNIDQNNDVNDINDALWCQSANNITNIGVWYYPNGTEVPLFDGPFDHSLAPSPLFSKRFSGQIALARSVSLSGYEGLYKCIIPDENGVNQTLVAGAYTDTEYNNNDGPDADPTMQFSLLSTSRLATPPVFSLSFNVSDGPPTTVNCSVNATGISTELSRVILNGPGSITRVRVTVRLREAGSYQCTVSNDRVTNGPISVSDTPTGLNATRLSTGLAHVRLSWSTVSGATGYEVYYQLFSNTPVSVGTTASTAISIISGLFRGITYTFYVVSYGSASLPSGNSSVMITISEPVVNNFMATLITSTAITLTWSPPTALVPISYNINRRCSRVCESSTTGSSETSVSSPHTSTGIPPYSQCTFDLNGVYDVTAELTRNYSAETLSTAPSAPVGDIIFSSVESVSMTVSWDEVPCNGRNGPITGYYLTYTNITSNTSYTVNITGGDNRMYNFTGLIPYTNYTMSIIPYNYNMNGPARQEIQLTAESIPGLISNLLHARNPTRINIVWNPPTIPNGIITVYEIRYRESTSTGPYTITNTTNTEYSIAGLILNASYTIGVRAYTSIGPGEWTNSEYSTIQIRVQLYLPYQDRIIPDYSMTYASQFYNTDQNNDVNNIIDALWCQSANTSINIGVWYYPNGTEVPLFDGAFDEQSGVPQPVFSKRFSGQIALARSAGLLGYEGLYKCIIPDENGVDQTLVVGAYTDTGYNNNDGPDADPTMQFSLLSTSRLATPPVFSLSFNVSDGPPTTVNCSVNGNGISTELSRVIVNGTGSVTKVTVTVRLREAGNYQCNVSNDRVTDGNNGVIGGVQATSSSTVLSLSVSDTPIGLTATRLNTGLAHVRLSWSTVSGATGYEVYYQLSSNTPVSVFNTSNTIITIIALLSQGSTYTFYVVSYGSASLPSGNASVMLTISNPIVNDLMDTVITNFAITLTWSPPTALVPISYNINRRCRRVCESSVTSNSETSVSSPHTSTGIPPYSQCGFDLIGVYGSEIAFLRTNYLATTLLTPPTAPVGDIIFSSVESVSMTVSWDEVPCNGRNGPITGYYLTYTNITSNTSYTVNITGGDNRMYNLTGLIPYTNYTVSIIPYNYNMNGPARQEIQLTAESIPGVISNLIYSRRPTEIALLWNPPTIPNGIITVYEIRYRESTSTGPYNTTNTTNTYYSIVGLIPNTSYTIGVRAYTSIGPGEWTNREYATAEIPVIQTFSITKLNSTAVRAEWSFASGASHYTVYYESTSSSSRKKRQVETGMRVFPGDTTEGLIGGLDPNLNYLFSISTSFNVNGIIYEGERTQPIPPGVTLSPTIISSTSSVIIGTGLSTSKIVHILIDVSFSYSIETSTMTTPLTTVLVNNGGNIGVIVGLSVVFPVLLVLAITIIIILVLVMYIKRTNINQKRKSDNDIVMECSPAYATTEFKTKPTVEPVYDTTNNEYETPLPPPAEYEIPTV
uniref:Uncharacterized protein n=1 Tax=Amphimedon queenslandica TaxID=400682 RepID=A0A1X7TBV8_AMPQE